MTRAGYTFVGWNTNSGGTGTSYNGGASYTVNSNVTLYAKWTAVSGNSDTFTDSRDNKTYKKVTIGSQTWMAENLNYAASGSWCYSGDDCSSGTSVFISDGCSKYGRLYDWNTAMGGKPSSSASPSGIQGVCPSGWHLPSRSEWGELAIAAGGIATYGNGGTAGTKLKSSTGWNSHSGVPVGTDEYGFSALPGGWRDYREGRFHGAGNDGHWWTATERDSGLAYYRSMDYGYEAGGENGDDKRPGYSVRCVQD
jgi:uncharacterized protein (TIGR02145 family)/uncharacterized repeat protein (TIGR02543 family)